MTPRKDPQIGLGKAIRKLRTDRGLTQEDLAAEAGFHPTWIGLLERGQGNPTWGTTKRVARALKVSHAVLATLDEALEDEGTEALA